MGSQDDHRRRIAGRAQFLQERNAAAIRQAQIEQDKTIGHGAQGYARIVQRLHPIDGMIGCGDVIAHRFAQYFIVLDEQNTQAAGPPYRSIPPAFLFPLWAAPSNGFEATANCPAPLERAGRMIEASCQPLRTLCASGVPPRHSAPR
jgi:hypothetical protein